MPSNSPLKKSPGRDNDGQAIKFCRGGSQHCAVAEMLRPFELPMKDVAADYQPVFVFYGIDSHADYAEAALRQVARSAAEYLAHLEKYFP